MLINLQRRIIKCGKHKAIIATSFFFFFTIISFWVKTVLFLTLSFSSIFIGRYLLCPEWQALHLTFISVSETWRKFMFEQRRSLQAWDGFPGAVIWFFFFFCLPLSVSFLWKVNNTLAVASFENRATPKKPSEMAAEGYAWRILKKERPSGYPDLVSTRSGFQKQRNSRENQGRTSPQATSTPAAAVTTTTPISLTNTQHSKGDFMHPSMRHPFSLVTHLCWFDIQGDMTSKRRWQCVCLCEVWSGPSAALVYRH